MICLVRDSPAKTMRSSQTAFVAAAAASRAAWHYCHPCISAPVSLNASPAVTSRRSSFVTSCLPRRRYSLVPYVARERRNHVVPQASAETQQDAAWSDVHVTKVQSACEGHTLLTLNVGITFERGSLTDSYRIPGMFVQLRPVDAEARGIKPGFFAISSAPTISGIFEFLIKDTDSTAWINGLVDGDVIQSSPVMGKGFPFSSLPTPPSDVLLFATGSGIAPIRAAIESVLNGIDPRKRRSVILFYGARTPQNMPYTDRFPLWSDLGVKVVPIISRPQQASEPWTDRTGYVQHALAEIGITDPANTAAILCGVKGMAEEVKAALIDAGVPESNVLFNF